jgi:hypothetical protein
MANDRHATNAETGAVNNMVKSAKDAKNILIHPGAMFVAVHVDGEGG